MMVQIYDIHYLELMLNQYQMMGLINKNFIRKKEPTFYQ